MNVLIICSVILVPAVIIILAFWRVWCAINDEDISCDDSCCDCGCCSWGDINE